MRCRVCDEICVLFSSGKGFHSLSKTKGTAEKWLFEDANLSELVLDFLAKLPGEFYVCDSYTRVLGPDGPKVVHSSTKSDREKWLVSDAGGGKVIIESLAEPGILSVEKDGVLNKPNRGQVKESWLVTPAGDGRVFLTSPQGMQIGAQGNGMSSVE